MRTNLNVQPGQVWQLSDPRRLGAFRVEEVVRVENDATLDFAYITWLTTRGSAMKTAGDSVDLDKFAVLGSKGYTRVS